ncbi:MAG: host attachment protein [Opitutaceae bacterium]|nr:host attachment protein [Opitutaceae bacterium]
MSEHYIVAADAGHLRIYAERVSPGQFTPGYQQVESMDFPAGKASYTDRETDMAGRFQSSKSQAGAGPGLPAGRTGMSIDERLPMKREEGRRRARDLAAEIDSFMAQRPGATWDFAAGPELNNAVLEQISPPVRQRLKRSIAKDIVNQAPDHLRAHFANAR